MCAIVYSKDISKLRDYIVGLQLSFDELEIADSNLEYALQVLQQYANSSSISFVFVKFSGKLSNNQLSRYALYILFTLVADYLQHLMKPNH